MIHVRDARVEDLEALLFLGAEMHAETIEPYPPIDRDHFEEYLRLSMERPASFLTLIAEDPDPVGMLLAVAGPYSFSPRLRGASDILFVRPERRGSHAAIKLIRRYDEWAANVGVDLAALTVATGVSPERTGRFFELMGYRPMATVYQKDYA